MTAIELVRHRIASIKTTYTNDDPGLDIDFDPQDMFGGNFDDAYHGGRRDGEQAALIDEKEFLEQLLLKMEEE